MRLDTIYFAENIIAKYFLLLQITIHAFFCQKKNATSVNVNAAAAPNAPLVKFL